MDEHAPLAAGEVKVAVKAVGLNFVSSTWVMTNSLFDWHLFLDMPIHGYLDIELAVVQCLPAWWFMWDTVFTCLGLYSTSLKGVYTLGLEVKISSLLWQWSPCCIHFLHTSKNFLLSWIFLTSYIGDSVFHTVCRSCRNSWWRCWKCESRRQSAWLD
jgi:hypothetical protein